MLRFRLRTLLIVVAVLSLGLAAVVAPLLRHRRQHAREVEIVASLFTQINERQLTADISWTRRSRWPSSSARLIGSSDAIFERVYAISVPEKWVSDLVVQPDGSYMRQPLERELPSGLFDRLPELQHLTFVCLNQCRVTPAEFDNFARCRLKQLSLYDCLIDPQCYEYFGRLAHLRSLDLSSCRSVGTGMLARIDEIPELTKLRLANCEITDDGFDLLADMKSLDDLDLHRTRVNELGLKALSRLRELRILNLENSEIDPAQLEIVARYPSLEILTLSAKSISAEAANALTKSPNLRRIIIPDRLVIDQESRRLKLDPEAHRILLDSGLLTR